MGFFAFFLSPLGRYVGIGVAVLAALGGVYIKGDLHGADRVQSKWDAANVADVKRGEDARAAAERDIPPVGAPDVPTGGVRGILHLNSRVPNDKWDRDQGAVRPVARDKLLGKPGQPANRPANPRPQPSRPNAGVLGVIEPSAAYPCWQVRLAMKTLSKETIDKYAAAATPEQRAAGAKCLAERAK